MQHVRAVEPLPLLDERFRPDHLLDRRETDDDAEHVRARRVVEPEIVHARDAVPGVEDDVHEVTARVDFSEPVRKRDLGVVPQLLERLEDARQILLLDEDVDVLRVARHMRVV